MKENKTDEIAADEPAMTNTYLQALQAPRLLGMAKKEARQEVAAVVKKCLLDLSQVMDVDTVNNLVTGTLDDLAVSFKTCTTAELKILMAKGIRREYGDYFGFNVVAVNGWIKAFVRSPERVKALQGLMGVTHAGPNMSPEEAEQEWKKVTLNRFILFKQTGRLDEDFPTNLYNELTARGLITFDTATRWEIYRAAEKVVFERKERIHKTSMVRSERNDATGFMNRMVSQQLTDRDKFEVQQEARLMSIRRYYESVDELRL